MGGKASRDKGNRFEREIVAALIGAGLDAYRVPLSGAQRGFNSDVVIRGTGGNITIEAKSRGNGFGLIYQAIAGNDMVAIKADRLEPLLVFRLSDVARLIPALNSSISHKSTGKSYSSQATEAQAHKPYIVSINQS